MKFSIQTHTRTGFLIGLSAGIMASQACCCVHFSSLIKYVEAVKDFGQDKMNPPLYVYVVRYHARKWFAKFTLWTHDEMMKCTDLANDDIVRLVWCALFALCTAPLACSCFCRLCRCAFLLSPACWSSMRRRCSSHRPSRWWIVFFDLS